MKLLINNHFEAYRGLSILSWQGIFLAFIESSLVGICYFLSMYLVNVLHFTVIQSGIIISCYGIGTIFGGILAGKLCDYFNPAKIRIISLIIQSLSFLALLYFSSFSLVV